MTKASDNPYPSLLLEELDAAPASPTADYRRLYFLEDGVLYSKDSAGNVAPAAAETFDESAHDAHDHTGVPGVGGGAGGGYTLVVDEDGSDFSGFTAHAGTWASDGTIIQQTGTSASVFRARYDTIVPTANMVAQVDIRFPSTGTRSGGIMLGWPGTNVANYPLIQLVHDTTDKLQISQDALANPLDATVTVDDDTWYTVTARVAGYRIDAYLDGTFVGSANLGGNQTTISANYLSHFVGLRAFDGTVDFRNFKVWVPTLPS